MPQRSLMSRLISMLLRSDRCLLQEAKNCACKMLASALLTLARLYAAASKAGALAAWEQI